MGKKVRIITATNDSATYIHFWPTIAAAWKNMFGFPATIGYVTNNSEDSLIVKQMKKCGEVELFKPIKNIPGGNQAKVTRMWLSTQYPDEHCIIVDLDMYMLNKKFFEEKWLSQLDDSHILAIGKNAYNGSPSEGKFPMCYTMGKGDLFKKILNPENLGYKELLLSWGKTKVIDGKEKITNEFNKFSDESLLRSIIQQGGFNNKIKHIPREDFSGMRAQRRIDRINFSIDIQKLYSGYYIDCAPERPLVLEKMAPIFEYLGLKVLNKN